MKSSFSIKGLEKITNEYITGCETRRILWTHEKVIREYEDYAEIGKTLKKLRRDKIKFNLTKIVAPFSIFAGLIYGRMMGDSISPFLFCIAAGAIHSYGHINLRHKLVRNYKRAAEDAKTNSEIDSFLNDEPEIFPWDFDMYD